MRAKPFRQTEGGPTGTASPGSCGPNRLERGRVSRTMWPPEAGTQHLLRVYREALVCVRHREDPAGYRRVVTVELVIGPVAARARQQRLREQALYPGAIETAEHILRAQATQPGCLIRFGEQLVLCPGRRRAFGCGSELSSKRKVQRLFRGSHSTAGTDVLDRTVEGARIVTTVRAGGTWAHA
jgi:hypothetical protein